MRSGRCVNRIVAVISSGAIVLISACHSGKPSPAAAPALAESPSTPVVRQGGVVKSETNAESVASWRPDRAAVDSGGECVRINMPAPGAHVLSVQYPDRKSAETTVSMMIDASGTLRRYTESRGTLRTPGSPSAKTDAERDSIVLAARALIRRTSIQLDFVSGLAFAANSDGGRPNNAVSGSVALFSTLPAMGAPAKRLERAREICKRAGVQ